jgi:GMP synthase (glutamine-hydrolysing)
MLKILIVNNAEPEINEFTNPFKQIVSDACADSICIDYKQCDTFNFDEIDGIILSGSPQGNDIVEHHSNFFRWIKTSKKPILGICAGHHITGFLFGAEILRSIEPESGDFEVEIVKQDPIFEGFSSNFRVKQMHNDSITLPENFELLATSKTCKVQLMKHKQLPLYTSQFHPEFYNTKLIRNFLQLCNKTYHNR